MYKNIAFAMVFVAIVVPISLGWLLQSADVEAKKRKGITWLEYGIVMKGFALFGVAIVTGLIAVWLNVAPKDKNAVLFIVALFSGLTLPMVIEVFFVRIGFDDRYLYCFSGWRRKRVIAWNDITGVNYSSSMKWWLIRTKANGHIRVSICISGLRDLLPEFRKKGIRTNR